MPAGFKECWRALLTKFGKKCSENKISQMQLALNTDYLRSNMGKLLQQRFAQRFDSVI